MPAPVSTDGKQRAERLLQSNEILGRGITVMGSCCAVQQLVLIDKKERSGRPGQVEKSLEDAGTVWRLRLRRGSCEPRCISSLHRPLTIAFIHT
jgi:hypothetical protein